jgi:hypothetical protein
MIGAVCGHRRGKRRRDGAEIEAGGWDGSCVHGTAWDCNGRLGFPAWRRQAERPRVAVCDRVSGHPHRPTPAHTLTGTEFRAAASVAVGDAKGTLWAESNLSG